METATRPCKAKKAVSAYFTREQIVTFGFARQSTSHTCINVKCIWPNEERAHSACVSPAIQMVNKVSLFVTRDRCRPPRPSDPVCTAVLISSDCELRVSPD